MINTFQLAPNLLYKRREMIHVGNVKKNKGEGERGIKGEKRGMIGKNGGGRRENEGELH